MAQGKYSPAFLYQPNAKLGAAAAHATGAPLPSNALATASAEQLAEWGFTLTYLPPASPWMLEQIHGNRLLWAEGLNEDGFNGLTEEAPLYLGDEDPAHEALYAGTAGYSADEIYNKELDAWDELLEETNADSLLEAAMDELCLDAQEDPDLKAALQDSLL